MGSGIWECEARTMVRTVKPLKLDRVVVCHEGTDLSLKVSSYKKTNKNPTNQKS